MNIKFRFVNKKNLSLLGIVSGGLMSFLFIILMLFRAFYFKNYTSENFDTLLMDIFELIFFLVITSNFLKSRSEFYYVYVAILLLIISNYVFPLIELFISGILNLTLVFPSITIALGVVYFVFLAIENKKRTKKSIIALQISGIIFSLITLAYGIYSLVSLIQLYSVIAMDTLYLMYFFVYILFSVCTMICLPIIYLAYPFVLYKERYI